MARKPKQVTGRTSVGVSADGRELHFVRLGHRDHKFYVLDARTFLLNQDLGQAPEEAAEKKRKQVDEDQFESIDITSESEEPTVNMSEESEGGDEDEDLGVMVEIARLARGSHFAVTLAEPQLFYHVIEQAGDKKKKKDKAILEELAQARHEDQVPTKDAVHLQPMTELRTLAVMRNRYPRMLEEFERARPFVGRRLPDINAIESFELSLVNLLLTEDPPEDDQVSVILHVGRESSRLLFLIGKERHHVSNVIAEGSQSRNIGGIVASRLTFELDHLNLDSVDQILLSGEACKADVADALAEMLPDPVETRCLTAGAERVILPEGRTRESIAPHAAALAAAMRQLEPKQQNAIHMDLTPKRIRDEQNKLLLTAPGWVALLLIPLVIVGGSWKYMNQREEIYQLRTEVYPLRIEMERNNRIEAEIAQVEAELNEFDRSFAVLDSLSVDNHQWSGLLNELLKQRADHRYLWFLNIAANNNGAIDLSGTSLYRETISDFVNSMSGAELTAVDVEEIREKDVYRFDVTLPATNQ